MIFSGKNYLEAKWWNLPLDISFILVYTDNVENNLILVAKSIFSLGISHIQSQNEHRL
jgi:hypothetical protein